MKQYMESLRVLVHAGYAIYELYFRRIEEALFGKGSALRTSGGG